MSSWWVGRRKTWSGSSIAGWAFDPEAIKDAGYLDPDLFMYAEEWDLAIRVRNAGWRFHFDPEIRVHHRTGDEARNLELRRTLTTRNEVWIVFKYYPIARIPVLLFRVLYWNIQTARDEGARSSPWYALKGFLRACWHWRTPVAKRQTIDPEVLDAFELRTGFTALQPARPAIQATLLRRFKVLKASILPR